MPISYNSRKKNERLRKGTFLHCRSNNIFQFYIQYSFLQSNHVFPHTHWKRCAVKNETRKSENQLWGAGSLVPWFSGFLVSGFWFQLQSAPTGNGVWIRELILWTELSRLLPLLCVLLPTYQSPTKMRPFEYRKYTTFTILGLGWVPPCSVNGVQPSAE